MPIQKAKFSIGDIVKHKHFEFRGVIYDVDFEFNNSEEWYQSIPKNVIDEKIPSEIQAAGTCTYIILTEWLCL